MSAFRRTVLLLLAAAAAGRTAAAEGPAEAWERSVEEARPLAERGDCGAAAAALESAVPLAEAAFGPSAPQTLETRLRLIEAYRCAPDLRKARRGADEIVRAAGDDPASGLTAARALLAAERERDAEKALRRIIAGSPENTDALIELAGILSERDEYGEAARCLEKARDLYPGDAQIAYMLGRAYRNAGRTEEARETLRAAVESCPDCFHAHIQLGYASPVEPSQGWTFERAVEIEPENPEAWHHLGVFYGRIGRLTESEQAFKHALELMGPDTDPGQIGWTLAHFAAMYQQQRGRAEEIAALHEKTRELVRRNPDHIFLRRQAALIASSAQAHDEAALHHRIVAQKGSPSERLTALIRLGSLEAKHKNDLVAAEVHYKQALPLLERLTDLPVQNHWCALAGFYKLQGRWEEAEKAYERALSSRAEFPSLTSEAAMREDLRRVREKRAASKSVTAFDDAAKPR